VPVTARTAACHDQAIITFNIDPNDKPNFNCLKQSHRSAERFFAAKKLRIEGNAMAHAGSDSDEVARQNLNPHGVTLVKKSAYCQPRVPRDVMTSKRMSGLKSMTAMTRQVSESSIEPMMP
jgi:hypothetical protein